VISLLAIDSGHPECAAAAAYDGRVAWVGSLSIDLPPAADLDGDMVFNRVVVEIPTLRGDNTPNPEDLLLIAVRGARLAERFASDGRQVTELRPREWKGNTPKPPHHLRMWSALDDAERELLGGTRTAKAIDAACKRGAANAWRKPGATYYRASEFPTVNGTKITHDILDAVALALYALKRIRRG
jgi:hypothetical protein